MTKLTKISIALVALSGAALAQPKAPKKTPKKTPPKTPAPKDPAPTPTPDPTTPVSATPVTPPAPTPTPTPNVPSPNDKPGANEGLGQGSQQQRPWADGVSDSEQKKALELFRDGNRDLNDAAFVVAAKKYREALTHWKHPAIHYNLALALLNLDNPLEVWQNLQAAVKWGEVPLEKEKYDKALEYIKVIEASSIATIEVTCSKPGGEIVVDGKKVKIAPDKYTEKVRAGKHVFSCEPGKDMQGYTTKVKAPYIDPGSKYRVDLKLYTTDELTRYHRRWDRTWAPWTVAAAGVVLAGVGGLMALSAQSDFDSYDSKIAACNTDSSGNGCTVADNAAIADLKSSGEFKRTMSYVGYGVGGGAVVLGLTLAYLNRKTPYQIRGEEFEDEQDNKQPGAAATPGAVSITPLIAPDMAGAMVFGHF